MKKKLFAAFLAGSILCSLCACAPKETPVDGETTAGTTAAPSEAPAYPVLITYGDYLKMTPTQQQAYYETFPDAESYMQWFNAAALEYNQNHNAQGNTDSKVEGNVGQITQPTEQEAESEDTTVAPATQPEEPTEKPIQKPTAGEQEGKDPVWLSFADYLKMNPAQQQAYYATFSSPEAFMVWYNAAADAYSQNQNDGNQVEDNVGQVTQPTAPEEKPNDTNTMPTVKPETPTEEPDVPTQKPEKPSEAPDVPTQKPEKPSEAPDVPTQKPEEPSEAPDVPTQKPEEPSETPTQAPTDHEQEKNPVLITYEEYLKLTPAQQQAYYEAFPNNDAYMEWFNQATKEYSQNREENIETTPTDATELPGNQHVGGLGGSASQGEVDF